MQDRELAVEVASPYAAPTALVPAGYAEKAMASLMQLHSELMDEKERRVDLYRRLMEKEQAVAELRMYVKLLEEKVGKGTEALRPAPVAEARPGRVSTVAAPPLPRPMPQPSRPALRPQGPTFAPAPSVRRSPPATASTSQRVADGWKTW